MIKHVRELRLGDRITLIHGFRAAQAFRSIGTEYHDVVVMAISAATLKEGKVIDVRVSVQPFVGPSGVKTGLTPDWEAVFPAEDLFELNRNATASEYRDK